MSLFQQFGKSHLHLDFTLHREYLAIYALSLPKAENVPPNVSTFIIYIAKYLHKSTCIMQRNVHVYTLNKTLSV